MLTVKVAFTWKHGVALETEIPAGAPVHPMHGEYWVNPSYFAERSMDHHDATFYGCRVAKDNIAGL